MAINTDNLTGGNVDDRRRLVLPECFPAGCAVIIHQLDDETLVISRAKRNRKVSLLVLRDAKDVKD